MNNFRDWEWKLRDAVDRIKNRYEHIGRKTGYPFLAIVYPLSLEEAVLKEWHTLLSALGPEFDVRTIDVLEVTTSVVEELGVENIVGTIEEPMPGSNPESELGHMWVTAVAAAIREEAAQDGSKKIVIVLERLAALYPAAGPRAAMQALWDSMHGSLGVPIVVLIPGTLKEARVYSFVNQQEEFMYRGDIL